MATKAEIQRIADYYKRAIASYEEAVLSGKRNASIAEKQKVQRQIRDLKEGVPGFEFDLNIGIRPLVWIAINLRFPLGERIGKNLQLSDWQAWDTAVLFGWVKKGKPSERRFVDAYIEIARKNGKSTYAGAILDYLAFGEREGVNCYIAATSLEQAEECLLRAGRALKLAKGATVKLANSKNNKQINWKSGMIRAIAAEPKDGKLAYGTVIDEYHQHRSNDLIDSIKSGNVSDLPSLLLRITTAGTELNGVCHEEYEQCKRILAGEASVSRYFISIYELDPKDDPNDKGNWEKANPNMGISTDLEKIEANYEKAKISAPDFIMFKTKNLNMWCQSLTRWANMPIWLEKCKWTVDEGTLDGKRCYGGLDLSSVSDFTAFTLDFPQPNGSHVQLSHFWIAENMKETIARQCLIPIDRWISMGWVTATPGDVIDYDYVRDYLNECYCKYQLMFIGADRWRLEDLKRIMPPWFVDVAYEFGQGLKSMSPSIEFFERNYLEGTVTANGNEVIDWMMGCAEVFQDSSGNVKLVKPKRQKSGKRIDGVITSVMALDVARAQDNNSISAEDIERMVSFI